LKYTKYDYSQPPVPPGLNTWREGLGSKGSGPFTFTRRATCPLLLQNWARQRSSFVTLAGQFLTFIRRKHWQRYLLAEVCMPSGKEEYLGYTLYWGTIPPAGENPWKAKAGIISPPDSSGVPSAVVGIAGDGF
jgi:hypothetical protein